MILEKYIKNVIFFNFLDGYANLSQEKQTSVFSGKFNLHGMNYENGRKN